MVISLLETVPQKVPIRPMSLQTDLNAVADLIEESFSLQQDADGQVFLKQMRQAARDARFISWVGSWQDLQPATFRGFVWVEQGKVVGNISLIPFSRQRRNIILIANVAVKQDFRRRGIARALTTHALRYLHQKGIKDIWLQVNAINQAAINLYESLDFKACCTRTTWQHKRSRMATPEDLLQDGLVLRRRKSGEDALQSLWLEEIYPNTITWHFPIFFEDFSKGIIWDPSRWIEALKLRHWALQSGDQTLGFLTWQRTDTYADNLWLAINPQADKPAVIQNLLMAAIPRITHKKPLSVDFPEGQASESFQHAGFSLFRSLIWMKYLPDASH